MLVDNYQGKLLNGPNDVWINPTNGGIYITDPIFPRVDIGMPAIRVSMPWEPTRSVAMATGQGWSRLLSTSRKATAGESDL